MSVKIKVEKREFENFTDLPFILRSGRGKNRKSSNWHLPDDLSYGQACRLGSVYAVYFMQHLLDSPITVGSNSLGNLIDDMAGHKNSDAKGVAVGFFSALEQFIGFSAKNADIWSWLNGDLRRSLEFEGYHAARVLEEDLGTQILVEME